MKIKYQRSLYVIAFLCMVVSASANAQATYESGALFFGQENFTAAQREWTDAAATGDSRAQYMLGLALTFGRYFPGDTEKGLAYLTAASTTGNSAATFALYQAHKRLKLGPISESIKLLETAAAQGSAIANITLEHLRQVNGLDLGSADLDMLIPTKVTRLAENDRAAATLRGEKVFQQACGVCHFPGLMNAPKPGDQARWTVLGKKGFDVLVRHAIDGFKAHPPKGGEYSLSGNEVRDAVLYMSTARARSP
jgi:cytochrome c5